MKASAVEQQGTTSATDSLEHLGTKRQFWLLLFGLTLLYVFVVAIGNRRYVWYDELFTFDIARSPSFTSSGTGNSSSITIRQPGTC
jgi:hypothetical protein